MNYGYDLSKLKRIIDDLCAVTGLCMAIADTEGSFLYTGGKRSGCICERIQKTPEGHALCSCSDRDMISRAKATHAPISHICHAGLRDTAVPIFKYGSIAGYVLIGRVRESLDTDSLKKRLQWLGEDEERLSLMCEMHPHLTDAQLTSLINLISDIVFENAVFIESGDLIKKATDYIEEHLSDRITVEELCKLLFVSKNQLYKSFDVFYRETVNEYITRRRMELAVRGLRSGKSVRETAASVGFDNYTYFSKLFKKKTGLTPGEFKRLNAKSQ